ncbi:hypothetical protein [Nocardioides taihuensis]|uniref:DUF4352 domain-containing protein n=1 Tax=Nocardioides taihuensis TaxID=1835606 RepID=A0ABW0BK96_9ACTN
MSGLREAFDELTVGVPVYGDLDRAIERAAREQRHRNGVVAGLAAAAAVVAVVAGAAVVTDDDTDSRQPITPATTATPPSPTEGESADTWEPPEPLRNANASRVVTPEYDLYGNALPVGDSGDAAIADVDIVSVGEAQDGHGGSSWRFQLAARPQLDPVGRVIAYGVVVDGDGDFKADCQIGINNEAPERGAFHVWVTNLRTRETAVQDGAPYGMPVEFSHPAEPGMGRFPPEMSFGFLRGLEHPAPCDPFDDSSIFYVWSSATAGGQVVARDFAPDSAWTPIRWPD